MSPVVFTLDLEDHRPDESALRRYPEVTDRLLDDLDEWGVRGTVFVVGEVVADSPELVRRVARRGHEIGLHGARHVPLAEVGPERFTTETRQSRDRLADVTGTEVHGFRAPTFSLVPESAWAPEILAEIGFGYSSSVLPARNPLYGWPGAPRAPFRWGSGLVELPSPTFGLGPVRLPMLGGTYLRLSPPLLTRWARSRIREGSAAWVYAHPYDFDPDEPRWRVPDVGRLGSRMLWWNRRAMRDHVRRLVEGSTRTMSDLVSSLGDLPTFEPGETGP